MGLPQQVTVGHVLCHGHGLEYHVLSALVTCVFSSTMEIDGRLYRLGTRITT